MLKECRAPDETLIVTERFKIPPNEKDKIKNKY